MGDTLPDSLANLILNFSDPTITSGPTLTPASVVYLDEDKSEDKHYMFWLTAIPRVGELLRLRNGDYREVVQVSHGLMRVPELPFSEWVTIVNLTVRRRTSDR